MFEQLTFIHRFHYLSRICLDSGVAILTAIENVFFLQKMQECCSVNEVKKKKVE